VSSVRSRIRTIFRESRSWVVPVIASVPLAVVLVLGLAALDPGWRRPILIVLPLLPWILIMLHDGWALFAIGLWMIPAILTMVIASGMPPGIATTVLGVTVVVSGGALCMHAGTWRRYGQFVRHVADWLIEWTLPAHKREAFRLALRTPGKATAEPAKAYRDLANACRQLDPPDDQWKEAVESVAAFNELAADMLDGTRPMDNEALKSAAKGRDRLLIDTMRAQSLVYRLVNYSPFRPHGRRPSD